MFGLSVFEFLSTIGAGLIVLLVLVYFYFLCQRLFDVRMHNNNQFLEWFREVLKIEFTKTGYAIAAGFLVFAVGTITEDITDHMADSEESKNVFIAFVKKQHILKREGELRSETLIKNDTSFTGLGKEVFSSLHYFYDSATYEKQKAFLTNEPLKFWKQKGKIYVNHEDSSAKITGVINGLYYISKNWCYLHTASVREELQEIQNRIDFSRSVCLISFIAFIILTMLYLVYYLRELLKGGKRFKVVVKIRDDKTIVSRRIFFPAWALVLLITSFCVSRMAYEVAEKNFNERAFGYYVSSYKLKKIEAEIKDAETKIP